MKKLYRVEIIEMVMADNETDAKSIAVKNADIVDCKAHEAKSCPSDWYDYIPWGEENDRTCGDIIKDSRS